MRSIMKSNICVFLLAVSVLANLALGDISQSQKASQRWHNWRHSQQRFPIAAWSYFHRFDGTKEEYQMYADANLTLVTIPDEHYDNAAATGLNLLLSAYKKPYEDEERLQFLLSFPRADAPQVVGLQMVDEPRPDAFSGIGTNMETIYNNNSRPLLPVLDLLPNWAWQRNTRRVERFGSNYDGYLRQFIREVHPPVLLHCHYPSLNDNKDRPEYYPNMETFRKHALLNDLGMMGFVINNAHWDYRQQSESDMRWQVYSHLAYGAQGIWYYNWRIKPVNRFGEGLVTYETGEPTREYWIAKAINSELLALGPVLMKLKSVNVFHTGESVPGGTRRFPNTGDPGSSAVKRFYGDDFIVGEFVNQDDPEDPDAYVMIVNKRHGQALSSADATIKATAVFKPTRNFSFAYYYNPANGTLKPLEPVVYNGVNGYYRMELNGGQGRLIRFSDKPRTGEKPQLDRSRLTALFAREKVTVDGLGEENTFKKTVPYTLKLCGDDQGMAPQESSTVKVTWHDRHLYISADFEDRDILAEGQTDDEPHYQLGDVFEVFLKPEYSDWYWEIWLTPHGKKTSLFWPEPRKSASGAEQYLKLKMNYAAKIDGTLNDSTDKDRRWQCEVDIPFAELNQSGKLHANGDWTILIARQNYTGVVEKEHRELSSYPGLSTCNFHAHRDYALLETVRNLKK